MHVLRALETMPVIRGREWAATLPNARTELASAFTGWSNIRAADQIEILPPVARTRLDHLEWLTESAAAAVDGDYLVHLDFRSDNVLIDAAGKAWMIDWPWAGVGCRWLDGLTFLVDARMHESGIDTEKILATHPLFADTTDQDIDVVLSGWTSYFFDAARRPAPLNMPTIRAFQLDEGMAGLAWLSERLGWSDSR